MAEAPPNREPVASPLLPPMSLRLAAQLLPQALLGLREIERTGAPPTPELGIGALRLTAQVPGEAPILDPLEHLASAPFQLPGGTERMLPIMSDPYLTGRRGVRIEHRKQPFACGRHEHLPELLRPMELHERKLGRIAGLDQRLEDHLQGPEDQRIGEVLREVIELRLLREARLDGGAAGDAESARKREKPRPSPPARVVCRTLTKAGMPQPLR